MAAQMPWNIIPTRWQPGALLDACLRTRDAAGLRKIRSPGGFQARWSGQASLPERRAGAVSAVPSSWLDVHLTSSFPLSITPNIPARHRQELRSPHPLSSPLSRLGVIAMPASTSVSKCHFLDNCDLRSLLIPPAANNGTTATKGACAALVGGLTGCPGVRLDLPAVRCRWIAARSQRRCAAAKRDSLLCMHINQGCHTVRCSARTRGVSILSQLLDPSLGSAPTALQSGLSPPRCARHAHAVPPPPHTTAHAKPPPHAPPTAVGITLGPACRDVPTLIRLLESGVTCARLDLTVRAVHRWPCSLASLTLQLLSQLG